MKRLFAAFVVVNAIVGVLLLSRQTPAGSVGTKPEFQIKQEALNPWNNLKLNNASSTFRFAIVSDNTGGPRPGVFSRAVDQLNILQPEFVVCVGDLIQGITTDVPRMDKQWKEFNDYIARLQVPFFYCVGNHDIANPAMEKKWKEQFGRTYYHFIYKNVLFMLLNCEDHTGTGGGSARFGAEQLAEVKKVFGDNQDVRWTMVFFHRPLWHGKQNPKSTYAQLDEMIKARGKQCTVFAGHEHHYDRVVRNDQVHYTLATTGANSKLRGAPFGEFDHIVWATMKDGGPAFANLMMEGIFDDDPRKASKINGTKADKE